MFTHNRPILFSINRVVITTRIKMRQCSISVIHTRKSLVKGERFIRSMWNNRYLRMLQHGSLTITFWNAFDYVQKLNAFTILKIWLNLYEMSDKVIGFINRLLWCKTKLLRKEKKRMIHSWPGLLPAHHLAEKSSLTAQKIRIRVSK